MIKTDDVNLLDWHSTRILNFIPEHFVRVKFRHDDKRMEVLGWLEKNIAGRFGIEVVVEENNDNTRMKYLTIKEEYQIGFENPGDATMYTMFFQ